MDSQTSIRHRRRTTSLPVSEATSSLAPHFQVKGSRVTNPSAVAPVAEIWGRLGPAELRRRLWHMGPGLLPVALWIYPQRWLVDYFLFLPAICLTIAEGLFRTQDRLVLVRNATILMPLLGLTIAAIRRHASIARAGESSLMASALGYSGTVIAALLLFPVQSEIAMAALAVLAFGDGSATVGGLLLRGPRLPWNPRKTWAGLCCFVACAAPLASIYYWAESSPGAPFRVALGCGLASTFFAAVAESVPSRINDNIRVGLVATAAAAVAHGLLLGWA